LSFQETFAWKAVFWR